MPHNNVNDNQEDLKNLYTLMIPKSHIINKKFNMLHDTIKHVKENEDTTYSKIVILFDGYNHDPDEVYEIMPIREWVSRAFKTYPHLFYMLSDFNENRNTILLCISNISIQRTEGKQSVIDWHKQGYTYETVPKHPIYVETPPKVQNYFKKAIAYGISKHESENVNEFTEWIKNI